jgi:hypothetical protein
MHETYAVTPRHFGGGSVATIVTVPREAPGRAVTRRGSDRRRYGFFLPITGIVGVVPRCVFK